MNKTTVSKIESLYTRKVTLTVTFEFTERSAGIYNNQKEFDKEIPGLADDIADTVKEQLTDYWYGGGEVKNLTCKMVNRKPRKKKKPDPRGPRRLIFTNKK